MAEEAGRRRRHPTWLRVVLVGLQALGIVVGVVVGTATYHAWSQPDDPDPPTTTTVVPEAPVPVDTLG
jgi:hypothetical protein